MSKEKEREREQAIKNREQVSKVREIESKEIKERESNSIKEERECVQRANR